MKIIKRRLQQPEDRDAIRRAYEHFSVRDHSGDELVSTELVSTSGSLLRVVKFRSEIRSVVGMQDGRRPILHRPENAIAAGTLCGDRLASPRGTKKKIELRSLTRCALSPTLPPAIGNALTESLTAP